MNERERKRLIASRIRRAQSALDRAMTMLDMHSHIETLESALVEAISECEEAEKLIQPIWAA